MNRKIFLTALWICALLVVIVSPAPAQSLADIAAVTPWEGTMGAQATITGTGFGEKQGEVLLGMEKCKLLAWSDTEITFLVDKPQPHGNYTLTVLLHGDKQPAEPLTISPFVMQSPQITVTDPPTVLVPDGELLTIEGKFFGDKKGDLRVAYLEGGAGGSGVIEDPKVVDWSMNTIRFRLPEGLVGKFILKVSNEVGFDFALLDLGGGQTLLGEYVPTPPPGYGNLEGHTNSSGIYYKGKFYVFSTGVPCGFFWCEAKVQFQVLANGKLSDQLWVPGSETDSTPMPVVVGDKLWLFITGLNDGIYYTIYNGTNWDNRWHQIPGGTYSLWEVSPVYNQVTGRITVYHQYYSKVSFSYSDDYGANWVGPKDVSGSTLGSISAAPSAVYYQPGGSLFNTLLAVRDLAGYGKVYSVKDGTAISELKNVGKIEARPFLVDDQGADGSDFVALIYATNYQTGPYDDYTPYIIKLNKQTGAWDASGTQAVYLPSGVRDNEVGFYYFDTYWSPNAAINLERNSSGGYDRKLYIFYGWYYASIVFDTIMEPVWMMTMNENSGPGAAPPPEDAYFTQVSGGQWDTCGLRNDGVIGCWGDDDGKGRTFQPPGVYKQVSTGDWHTCGLQTDGYIHCWGEDDGGRIYPSTTNTFTQISVAAWHGCGVRTNGMVDCWGKEDDGRIWDPPGAFKQVSTGNWHNCAIKSDDHVYCWGDEDDGRRSPPAADLFKQISSADWHNCGVRTNGTLVCWGNNDNGRVSNLPADANIPGTYTMVAAGNWHNCALRTNGSIACWGNNDDGRVTGAPTTGVFTSLAAGDRHTCAVRNDGHVICWGNNGEGQLAVPFWPNK